MKLSELNKNLSPQRLTHLTCPLCSSKSIQEIDSIQDHSHSKEFFIISKCSECNLIFTTNPPLPDQAGKYYENKNYISHSDTSDGLVNKIYHLVRTFMLRKKRLSILNFSKGRKILDYGSGTGYFLNEMQLHGWNVSGIEINQQARVYCKSKFNIETLAPQALLGLMENGQFDVISLWHVAEHIYDLNKTIEELNILLKPGGLLVIAVPNIESYDSRWYNKLWAGLDVPRHLYHFSSKVMVKYISNFGYTCESIKRMPFDGYYVSYLSESYKNTSFPLIKGLFFGFVTHLASMFNKNKSSSLCYYFVKSK